LSRRIVSARPGAILPVDGAYDRAAGCGRQGGDFVSQLFGG
jgi:hypothetical protein